MDTSLYAGHSSISVGGCCVADERTKIDLTVVSGGSSAFFMLVGDRPSENNRLDSE
jgi:hypothetical protein